MAIPTDDPIYKTDLGAVLLEVLDKNPELRAYFYPSRPQVLEETWSTFNYIEKREER